MNYPIWQLDFFGGGLLIAVIAVFHVYISHFAVGGGLFLVLTEIKGYRENDPAILAYVRKHTKFFLLLTMVAGGLSGVGIWFTIALLNPAATSMLIHTFVFAWAIEWVFFLIEIIALFIYHYSFGRMERKKHLLIGWIYFGAAWLSLFIINGIIDFMLTPGSWIENGNFWSGFFNPTFWPALFFRTFLTLIIAGLFGFLTSTWIREQELRSTMVRYCARWLLIPFALLLGSAYWYKTALPAELQTLIFQRMPEMKPFISGFTLFSPVLVFGGLLLAIRMPGKISRPIAGTMLIIGLLYMGCFEFIREGGRRPYIIRDYMYSTSLLKKDVPQVQERGVLQLAKWVQHREITDDNRLEVGREIFNILCLSCHSVGGPLNEIKGLTANFSPDGLDAMISGMHIFHPYMPPFAGTAVERTALAHYIANGLNNKPTMDKENPALKEKFVDIPEFDPDKDEYVLLAWSRFGMQFLFDAQPNQFLTPPKNALHAQLIKRGETPEIVSEDVTLSYIIEEKFPSPRIDKSPDQTNRDHSNTLTGSLSPAEGGFVAEGISITPYSTTGDFDPYQVVTVEARDTDGTLLAATKVVVPVSTELGCRSCHGGDWRVDNRAGISSTTAENILEVHDRLSDTDLLAKASAGQSVQCQNCHSEPLIQAEGKPQHLTLSASLHGFHANFLRERGAESCNFCHPSSAHGATRSFRGIHQDIGLECTNCHGSLEDHALSLLKAEQVKGKKGAQRLMNNLQPQEVTTITEIEPRTPWVNQPDCLNCHVDFEAPDSESAFNTWTENLAGLFRNRTDESGQLFCSACHSSPHSLYPAKNPYGEELDNIQPLQYQQEPLPMGSNRNCAICHTVEMEDEMHHPNMLREFRNF